MKTLRVRISVFLCAMSFERMFFRLFNVFSRWKCSHGYGVQSPFAYQFIRGVIHEQGEYYAYATLRQLSSAATKDSALAHFDMKWNQLFFRLANFVQPRTLLLPTSLSPLSQQYFKSGCLSAQVNTYQTTEDGARLLVQEGAHPWLCLCDVSLAAQFVQRTLMSAPFSDGWLLVTGINKDQEARRLWQSLVDNKKTVLTFDLYQVGLIFFNLKYVKQHYQLKF